jgi:hypothetical protein
MGSVYVKALCACKFRAIIKKPLPEECAGRGGLDAYPKEMSISSVLFLHLAGWSSRPGFL